MSTPPSETVTLGEEIDDKHLDIDVPIRVDEFLRHVRKWKYALGFGLLASLASEAWATVESIQETVLVDKVVKRAVIAERAGDIAGLVIISTCMLLYVLTVLKPIKKSPIVGRLLNSTSHRVLCMTAFLATLVLLVLHTLPAICYTFQTHQTSPLFHTYPLNPLRNVALILTFLAAGSIRRGPRLHHTPLSFGTGFGLNAEKSSPPGGRMIKGEIAPGGSGVTTHRSETDDFEENVLDYANSCMISFITLGYMARVAKRSTVVPQLDMTDLPHLEDYVRMSSAELDITTDLKRDNVGRGGSNKSGHQSQVTKWALVKSLWRGRGTIVFITFWIETLTTFISYLQIWSMHEIIASFADPSKDDRAYAEMMCLGLFIGQSVPAILQGYSWSRENYLLHIPVKMSVSSLLFTKILRLTDVKTVEAHTLSEEDTAAGKGRSQILNLLTMDAGSMAGLATHVWGASNALIDLCIGLAFLYQMFGVSAFMGIACIPLSGPISIFVSRQSYRADRAWSRARDARASALKEFLLCYKVIKLNAFEPFFRARIERLRHVEVTWQRWRFTLGTLYNVLADQLPALAIFIVFLFHTRVLGKPLEPAEAFVALTVFGRVQSGLQFIPGFVQDLLRTLVALDRLVGFLNRPETDRVETKKYVDEAVPDADGIIHFDNATLSWPRGESDEPDPKAFRLKDFSLEIPRGQLTLVWGPLGSGKTLFLRSLLGEAVLDQGAFTSPRTKLDATPVNGYSISREWTDELWLQDSVSYAPQQAYIRHGTIRDNILFGQPMWRARYKEVLRQASLLSDLGLLEDGDLTEVGDQGVNLSGGQKARINLARCIYSRAKTIYLDDVLSAVDAHTAQYIVRECLQGDLVKGRTVVLVTHHAALCLPAAQWVIRFHEGRVEHNCPAGMARVKSLEALMSPPFDKVRTSEENVRLPTVHHAKRDQADVEENQIQTTSRQFYKTEQSAVGRVATSHYMLVLGSAGGALYWTILLIFLAGTAIFAALRAWVLREWSSDSDASHLDHYLLLYFALLSSGLLTGTCRWIWLYGVRNFGFYNRGSRMVHQRLLNVVCGATFGFFETTPKGRLMNVFGGDIWRLDCHSADDFGRTMILSLMVGSSVLIVCAQAPLMLVVLVVLGLPTYWISGILGKLRADLRRLSSVASSPLVTLYNDAIEGIVMVRAFGCNRVMIRSMQLLMHRERQAWGTDTQVYNWVRMVIRVTASFFVAFTGLFLVRTGNISGAQIGFILSFALNTSQGLFGLLERVSNLEQTFVSAERINRYIQMDEQEPTGGDVPNEQWPASGAIKFTDISVRYAPDLPEVLHKVSFDIEPGMCVGLVGATGSGKSTLALTLFRAIELHEGKIEIDHVDISNLQLAELRSRLNMVVQDGTLCSGTLRDALDITGEKDDHEIYESLRRVHLIPQGELSLADMADNPFTNLDTFVAVEGANFSHGQRQLLCLARALLKGSKVLVMDEATSSVDFDMDAKITETIKECFEGTTMIVIAHRLATIMHFDRVLVLDGGEVQEYGSPADLIADPHSAFHGLCMAQGEEEFDKLAAMLK